MNKTMVASVLLGGLFTGTAHASPTFVSASRLFIAIAGNEPQVGKSIEGFETWDAFPLAVDGGEVLGLHSMVESTLSVSFNDRGLTGSAHQRATSRGFSQWSVSLTFDITELTEIRAESSGFFAQGDGLPDPSLNIGLALEREGASPSNVFGDIRQLQFGVHEATFGYDRVLEPGRYYFTASGFTNGDLDSDTPIDVDANWKMQLSAVASPAAVPLSAAVWPGLAVLTGIVGSRIRIRRTRN